MYYLVTIIQLFQPFLVIILFYCSTTQMLDLRQQEGSLGIINLLYAYDL